MRSLLANLLFILTFFPFLRIIDDGPQIQPVGVLVCLVMIVLGMIRFDRIFGACLLVLSCIAAYTILALILHGYDQSIILQTVAYSSAIFQLLGLKDTIQLVSIRVYLAIVGVQLMVGLLQFFDRFGAIIGLLRLDRIITGVSGGRFAGGRGVAFLTSEPSYGAFIIFGLLIFGLVAFLGNRLSKAKAMAAMLALGVCLLLNMSATAIALVSVFAATFGLCTLQRPGHRVMIIAAAAIAVTLGSLLLGGGQSAETRVNQLVRDVGDTLRSGADPYDLVAVVGGKRLLTTWVGYGSVFSHFGLGYGVAGYQWEFNQVAAELGISFEQMAILTMDERYAAYLKPDAYLASVTFDMGLIGVAVVVLLLRSLRPSGGQCTQFDSVRLSAYVTGCILVVGYSTSSLPTPWFLLALAHVPHGTGNLMTASSPAPGRSFDRKPTVRPHIAGRGLPR